MHYTLLEQGNKVLDIMCGGGKLWPIISEKIGDKGNLIGLDFCQEMTKINISFNQTNTLCIAFQENNIPSDSQNNIISTFNIKHLETADIALFMYQIERLLKSGNSYAFLELKMPKNILFKLFVKAYILLCSIMVKIFCSTKTCSFSHLKKCMIKFSKIKYTAFYANQILSTQIKYIFWGILVVIYGRKF